MNTLEVDGSTFLIVPAIEEAGCMCCHFEPIEHCPHQRNIVFCGGVDRDADNILIPNDPQAIADYMAERLS